jgi:hypothetical protein
MKDRPSYRECDQKLKQARQAVSAEKIKLLQPDQALRDLLELDYRVPDLMKDLTSILGEIKPRDYIGQNPPQRSYEKDILDTELFAFRWFSRIFGCDMYFKFAIKDADLWIVSLHRDRSMKGGE